MIQTGDAAVGEHPHHDPRDVRRRRRGHGLIVDDPERSPLPADTDHGLDEVAALAARSRHPEERRDTKDDDLVERKAGERLPHRLRGAVDVERGR